jgi:hypothetical protein
LAEAVFEEFQDLQLIEAQRRLESVGKPHEEIVRLPLGNSWRISVSVLRWNRKL